MVVEQEAVSLQLTPEAVAFRALGDTLRLVAEGVDANGHPVAVIWSSSDTTVAQMDASGLVTAVGYGTATIIATAGGTAESATVTWSRKWSRSAGCPLPIRFCGTANRATLCA